MSNLRTKIIIFLIILVSFELCFCQLSLEDIFINRKYEPKTHDISFFKCASKYTELEYNQIAIFNSAAKKTDSVLFMKIWPHDDLQMPKFQKVELSNTDKYLILKSNEERIYRRSGAADYYFTDGKNKAAKIGGYKISFPVFSTDDSKIAYVKDNNLYWYNIETKTEVQATNDGLWNKIINGKSDWVYEEEFSLTTAFAWCANSNKFVYLKFNETEVKEYTYPIYYGQTYPTNFSYKYPKAGEQNSVVTAHYYDCQKKKNHKINLSSYKYEYIPKIIIANNEVFFVLLNRHQDTLKVVSYNFKTSKTRLLFTDVSAQYVEVPNCFYVLKNNSFVTVSERDGFKHLFLFDQNGILIKQLTKGDCEITDTYGIDEKNKQIYYQSNEGNEMETSIFSLNYETLDKKKLSSKNGKNTAKFSSDFTCFLHNYSDAVTTPKISIRQTDLITSVELENNGKLQNALESIPQKEFLKIPINGYELNAWMIKPKITIKEQKYPLIMFVYGGPNNQQVLNEWQKSNDLFFNFLAEQGFVVACVDNRGTNGRGVNFQHSTYLNLGKLETQDQIGTANYFGKLSFIDESKIGIFGWSYGAYVSLLSIFQNETPFKAAVAVAPVTNWKYYDNIYTERYMRKPQENRVGYEQFNPIELAKNLKGNLMLIHATADDNVHFQNTVELTYVLNEAGKSYQLYIYPDKAHSISSSAFRLDLYNKILLFFKDNL